MKLIKKYFIACLLVIVFVGMSDCLMSMRDIYGEGNAVWGDSVAKTLNRFAKRNQTREVNVTQASNAVVIDYRRGFTSRKRYEFKNGGLYRIILTHGNSGNRLANYYNKNFGPYSRIENGFYIWEFPSTIITIKQGTNKAIFTDARYFQNKHKGKNIDMVRIGMTTNEVRSVMGTPAATATAAGGITTYSYRNGVITFQYDRVTKIEKGEGAIIQPNNPYTDTPSPNNILMVQVGMAPTQVTTIMGNPAATQSFGDIVLFKYTTGVISFQYNKVIKVETYQAQKQVQKKVIKKK